MEVFIKATLKRGITYERTLYFEIKYKLKGQWRYRYATHWNIVTVWDDGGHSESAFQRKAIEKFNDFKDGVVEEVIIDKVKEFLKQQKIDENNENEFDRLMKKYGQLKFKIKL